MQILLIALATFITTLLGGLFALRFKDKLHLILGFSAGAVIAVALLDLLPEAIELGSGFFPVSMITGIVAVGFLAYLLLDRLIFFHFHSTHHEVEAPTNHVHRGTLGAASLAVHSFLDGVAIGLAFQVSPSVGVIVTTAVLTHDFSDGINTVNLILKNQGGGGKAMKWLLVDAVAPVLGAGSTLFFTLPPQALSVVLALFAGFFLYIGASDLIPERHHAHPRLMTTLMTFLGVAVLYFAIQLSSV